MIFFQKAVSVTRMIGLGKSRLSVRLSRLSVKMDRRFAFTVNTLSTVTMFPKHLMRHQPFRDPSLTQNPVFNSRIDGVVLTVEYGSHHPRGALIRHRAMQDMQDQSEELGFYE